MNQVESQKQAKTKVDFPKRLYSVEEAGHYLGLSPRTIYNGIAPKSKKPFPIKPKRIRNKVLFDIKDLDRYVDSLDTQSSGT